MSFSDQEFLLKSQYKDASNLSARITIHERFSTNRYGWFQWVFDHFSLPARCRILELGCGRGDMWVKNCQRIPEGWGITLSDFSQGMLAEAQINLEKVDHPFRFEVIDAQIIPYGDKYFDAVIANHMLYHVPDRKKALAEIRRVLKPGSPLYATTVGADHLKELTGLTNRFFGSNWVYWGNGFVAEEFSLENGEPQIMAFFNTVSLHRYEDALEVTYADPLVDYIFSSNMNIANEGRRDDFLCFMEQEIRVHGAIHITKDSGIFVVS